MVAAIFWAVVNVGLCFVGTLVVGIILCLTLLRFRDLESTLSLSLVVAVLMAIFIGTKQDWLGRKATPAAQNTVPAFVNEEPPAQSGGKTIAQAAEAVPETVATVATATEEAPAAQETLFQRAKRLVAGGADSPAPAQPVQEAPKEENDEVTVANNVQPVARVEPVNKKQPVRRAETQSSVGAWYNKVPPVPAWLVVAAIVIMCGFAFNDLWHYDVYDEMHVTRLIFGVALCVGFLMFIPPLGTVVSWVVFVAIAAATLLLCFNHPHFAASVLIAAVIFTDAFTEWSLIDFVRNHINGSLIFGGAWLTAGIAEMLCVWWEIEEERKERREEAKSQFFNTHPRWQPADQVPGDVLEPATTFAIQHQELFEDMPVTEHSRALLARAPYGLIAFADRAANFFVPRAWRLMIDVTLRQRIEEYQRTAAAKTTIDFSTAQEN